MSDATDGMYLWALRMVQSSVSHAPNWSPEREGAPQQGVRPSAGVVLFGRFVDQLCYSVGVLR